MTPLEIVKTFDVQHIPNLDVVVLAALERFAVDSLPALSLHFERPLVLGSGNAFMAAQILFGDVTASFADESSYRAKLASAIAHDAVIIMSASGAKHAVPMTEAALTTDLPVHLITNTKSSSAGALLPSNAVHIFPKNREPYTYNTSTYLGPILAKTGENVDDIRRYIDCVVTPLLLRNFEDYSAYTFLLPVQFLHVRSMLQTKFDELFGPCVNGRFFTEEEVKHAKTVVVSGDELFISFGVENFHYGVAKNRLFIPLPEKCNYGALLAATYFVVGKIQAAHPPYFAQGIAAYAEVASRIFGHPIQPIVE